MTNKNLTEKQQFIELRAKGNSLTKIAKQLGNCRQTLANWHSELEEEIGNARAIELEALFEECLLTKEHRVKNLSDLLAKISSELDKRAFDEVSTEKLIEMKLKLSDQLKGEYVAPQIKSDFEIKDKQHKKRILNELCGNEN